MVAHSLFLENFLPLPFHVEASDEASDEAGDPYVTEVLFSYHLAIIRKTLYAHVSICK